MAFPAHRAGEWTPIYLPADVLRQTGRHHLHVRPNAVSLCCSIANSAMLRGNSSRRGNPTGWNCQYRLCALQTGPVNHIIGRDNRIEMLSDWMVVTTQCNLETELTARQRCPPASAPYSSRQGFRCFSIKEPQILCNSNHPASGVRYPQPQSC